METNTNITLYNKWYNTATRLDEWIRTYFLGISWYGAQEVAVSTGGLSTADSYAVRIPLCAQPTGKQYVSREAWAALASGALADFWTLQPGDVIVRGLSSDIAPPAASAKTERFVITAAADNRRGSPGMWHWRVNGK